MNTNIIKQKRLESIAIIGLGLIGGSLTKAFKRTNPGFKISAVDKSSEYLILAKKDGVIDDGFDSINDMPEDIDVIFLCTPVIMKTLAQKAKPAQ